MKIAFLISSAQISGGTNVILTHASNLHFFGHKVYILSKEKQHEKNYEWHYKSKNLNWLKYESAVSLEFDCVIATWWYTSLDLYLFKAHKYIYFIQSIESKFYKDDDPGRMLAEATYLYNIPFITEATWIQNYLEVNYGNNVNLVRNGIDKSLYKKLLPYVERNEKKFRILVEGAVDVFFKNVPNTINLCKKSNADEIWLLTPSKVKSYKGVDRVFSQIPMSETPKVYSSCDVIVKLSYVEGMFGPPLEMFHSGGTAIVYDVSGYDEYIKDGYNALVVNTGNEKKVVESINELKENKLLLENLKKGAIETADKWLNWEVSSKKFEKVLTNLPEELNKQLYLQSLTELIKNQNFKRISLKNKCKQKIKNVLEKGDLGRKLLTINKKIRGKI